MVAQGSARSTRMRRTLRNPGRGTHADHRRPERPRYGQRLARPFRPWGFWRVHPGLRPPYRRAPTWAVLAPAFQAEAIATKAAQQPITQHVGKSTTPATGRQCPLLLLPLLQDKVDIFGKAASMNPAAASIGSLRAHSGWAFENHTTEIKRLCGGETALSDSPLSGW